MKKAAAFLLSLSMLAAVSLTAFADDTPPPNTAPGEAVIGTEVPAGHTVTVTLIGEGSYTLDGSTGSVFTVERLAQPKLEITPGEGGEIVSVTLNGTEIVSEVIDGKYQLAPVYEDKDIVITIETHFVPPDSSESEPDSSESEPESSESEPESSESESKPDSSEPTSSVPDNHNTNPSTGVIGGVSAGTIVLIAALTAVKRKGKDSNEE